MRAVTLTSRAAVLQRSATASVPRFRQLAVKAKAVGECGGGWWFGAAPCTASSRSSGSQRHEEALLSTHARSQTRAEVPC